MSVSLKNVFAIDSVSCVRQINSGRTLGGCSEKL